MFKTMRAEVVLSIIAIAMSFVSGVLVLVVREGPSQSFSAPVLDREIQKFSHLNLSSKIVKFPGASDVSRPETTLPFYFQFPRAEVDALLKYAGDCLPSKEGRSSELAKAWLWEEHRCHPNRALPENFFRTPPLMHPSGVSYALLANKGVPWALENLGLFHLLEIKQLDLPSLPGPSEILRNLDWQALDALAREEAIVLGTSEVLILNEREMGQYRVFDRSVWDQFWSRTPFLPAPRTSGESCFLNRGNVCWIYDVEKAYFQDGKILWLLLGLSILLTVLLAAVLVLKIRRRLQQENRLQFALQMVTHELRTPLTNLILNVEELRHGFDEIPESQQESTLKVFNQVERLRRVADTSRFYLSKDLRGDLLKPQISGIANFRHFIESCIEPHQDRVTVELVDDRSEVRTDPYWASVCLKHLIENALRHGSLPILVTAKNQNSRWTVMVQDNGQKIFNPLEQGPASRGLGFGYKIVCKILPALRAKIQVRFQPTQFEIDFPEFP